MYNVLNKIKDYNTLPRLLILAGLIVAVCIGWYLIDQHLEEISDREYLVFYSSLLHLDCDGNNIYTDGWNRVTKTLYDGTTLWSQTLPFENNQVSGICTDKRGCVYLFGVGGEFFKLSPEGDVIWQKQLLDSVPQYMSWMEDDYYRQPSGVLKLTSNDSILAVFGYTFPTSDLALASFMLMDSDGIVIVDESQGDPIEIELERCVSGGDIGVYPLATTDQGFVIANRKAQIHHIGFEGELLWSIGLDDHVQFKEEWEREYKQLRVVAIECGNKIYIARILGYNYPTNAYDYLDSQIDCLSLEGETLWHKEFENKVTELCALPEDSVFVVGRNIMLLIKDGEEQWLLEDHAKFREPTLGDDGLIYVVREQFKPNSNWKLQCRELLGISVSGEIVIRVPMDKSFRVNYIVDNNGRAILIDGNAKLRIYESSSDKGI